MNQLHIEAVEHMSFEEIKQRFGWIVPGSISRVSITAVSPRSRVSKPRWLYTIDWNSADVPDVETVITFTDGGEGVNEETGLS